MLREKSFILCCVWGTKKRASGDDFSTKRDLMDLSVASMMASSPLWNRMELPPPPPLSVIKWWIIFLFREWREKAISVYEVDEGAPSVERAFKLAIAAYTRRNEYGPIRILCYYELHIHREEDFFLHTFMVEEKEREITGWLKCHYFMAWALPWDWKFYWARSEK